TPPSSQTRPSPGLMVELASTQLFLDTSRGRGRGCVAGGREQDSSWGRQARRRGDAWLSVVRVGFGLMKRRPHPDSGRRMIRDLGAIHRFVRPGFVEEITACQLNILELLDTERPKRPSSLATERGVTRSAVSHALRRLEGAGLVRRRRDPKDRRFVEVV